MAKTLQAGKLIIGAIAVSVDPTGTAAATLGIDSALQFKDWLTKKPDLAKLSAELDKTFAAEIAKPSYDKPEGIRILLPQMLEAGQPNGNDIAHHSLDAALIFETMQAKITDAEHRRAENLTAFRRAILPLLEQACDDPRLEQALRPALTRAQGAVNREQTSDIKAILAAVQAGQAGIPLKDLQDLAREFGEEITEGGPQVMEFLRSRATDFFALKAEVNAIPDTMRTLANLKAAAQDAIDRVDLEEVETLMALVHETELEEAAKSAEIRANTALLRGKVEDAFRYLSAAADSFAAIDPSAPAAKRLGYDEILYAHGLRYGSTGMTYASDMIRDAIALLDRDTQDNLWAGAQNNLANALASQGTRTQGAEGADLLAQAVSAFRSALEVYTRAEHPVDWAMTQNNLGNALQEQGIRIQGDEGADLLAQAVTAFRNALKVRTRVNHPVQWAMTQNNLAIALQSQSIHTQGDESADLLAQAVTAYRAALEVRTRADHPVDWARTQNNLGTALQDQGERTEEAEGADLLAQAVTAFRAALEVRARAEHPVDWAITQQNIALCEAARAAHVSCSDPRPHLTAALDAVDNALTVFDPVHLSSNHAQGTRLRDHIQAALDALPPE